jgi:hypothetical protein
MNTISIALALRLFSVSITWQLHTMIKVDQTYQLSHFVVGVIPSSQYTPEIMELSLSIIAA